MSNYNIDFKEEYLTLLKDYSRLQNARIEDDRKWSHNFEELRKQLIEAEKLLAKFNPDPRIIQWSSLDVEVKEYFDNKRKL